MEKFEFQTSLGTVSTFGSFSSFHDAKPLILVVLGAFQTVSSMDRFPERQTDCDVVIVPLPGMVNADFPEPSIQAFSRALDQLVATRFPNRRLLKFGISAGGLVALSMKSSGPFVVVDAPLSTGAVWSMVKPVRAAISNDPGLEKWAWNILGISSVRHENRDYRSLLNELSHQGVFVIAGDVLEPPRKVDEHPGVLTAADRELVASTPGLTVLVVPNCGHNIPRFRPSAIQSAIALGLELLKA